MDKKPLEHKPLCVFSVVYCLHSSFNHKLPVGPGHVFESLTVCPQFVYLAASTTVTQSSTWTEGIDIGQVQF